MDWFKGLVQGDLGQSFRFKMPVTELISERIINSFWLSVDVNLYLFNRDSTWYYKWTV